MMNFEIGDFIMLKEYGKYEKANRIIDVNIFLITSIGLETCSLLDIKQPVSLCDINPISINGVDDRLIYHNPDVMAFYIRGFEKSPVIEVDYSYYLDALKKCRAKYDNKTVYDIIIEKGFRYVHEVQHYLRTDNGGDYLRIKNVKNE